MFLFSDGSKDDMKYKNLLNLSWAIGYGVGSGSPLSPSFNFGLEFAKSSQVCSQFKKFVTLTVCLSKRTAKELGNVSFHGAVKSLIRVDGFFSFGHDLFRILPDLKNDNNYQGSFSFF